MPSNPTARASGSETLRASSTAVLKFYSTGTFMEESHAGVHHARERRREALAEFRAADAGSQRSRIQGLDADRHQQQGFAPVRAARGLRELSPTGDSPGTSSQIRPVMSAMQERGDTGSPKCRRSGQEARHPQQPRAASPAGPALTPDAAPARLGASNPTSTLIRALTVRVSMLHQSRRGPDEERPSGAEEEHPFAPRHSPAEPAKPAPAEPPGAPRYSSEGALPAHASEGHAADRAPESLSRPRPTSHGSRWQSLTVVVPRRHSMEQPKEMKDIQHIGDRKIFDLFAWDEVLQEQGDGGKVVVCKPKDQPGEAYDYVMKIRSKEALREQYHEEEFRRSQVRMLNFPPHVGVMPLREVLEDDKFYYIVMDKADGGTLFSSLLSDFQDGVLPHSAIRSLIRDLLEAVSHMHKQGMLHRDIKPDNLVMQFHSDPCSPTGKAKKVRLIDFDHADPDWSPASPRKGGSCYGTMRFNAPETFLGEYSAESDLYSVGAVLYLLMTGKMPYNDEVFEELQNSEGGSPTSRRGWMDGVYFHMKQEPIDWRCSPWPDELECKDLCASLLAFEARDRPSSAEEALTHSWLEH